MIISLYTHNSDTKVAMLDNTGLGSEKLTASDIYEMSQTSTLHFSFLQGVKKKLSKATNSFVRLKGIF